MASSGSIPPAFQGGEVDFAGSNPSSDPYSLPYVLNTPDFQFLVDFLSDPDAQEGKNRGGRRKKIIPKEQLLICGKCTLLEAATVLKVSPSTLKRRYKEHGFKGWSEVQESAPVSLGVHKVGRMQYQDKVVVQLHYNGRNIAFYLPLKATVRQLRKGIKDSLKPSIGTGYDIKYFAGNKEFSIVGDPNLEHCMSLASQSPYSPSKFIELTVADVLD